MERAAGPREEVRACAMRDGDAGDPSQGHRYGCGSEGVPGPEGRGEPGSAHRPRRPLSLTREPRPAPRRSNPRYESRLRGSVGKPGHRDSRAGPAA